MDLYTPPPPEPPRPKPLSKTKIFFLSIVPPALHMGVQAVAAVLMAFAAAFNVVFTGLSEMGADLDPYSLTEDLLSSPQYRQAMMLAVFFSGIASIALFYILYKRRKPPFRTVQPRSPVHLFWLVAVIAVAGNFVLTAAITAVQDALGTEWTTSGLDALLDDISPSLMLVTFLSVSIAAPFAEEFCFRGLSLNKLLAAFPFWKANVLQAALFGIIHVYPLQVGYAFLFGLLLGWIYHRTGRLGAAILGHIAFNASPFLLAFIPGADTLLEDPAKLLLFLCLPSAAVFCAAVRLLHKKIHPAIASNHIM